MKVDSFSDFPLALKSDTLQHAAEHEVVQGQDGIPVRAAEQAFRIEVAVWRMREPVAFPVTSNLRHARSRFDTVY